MDEINIHHEQEDTSGTKLKQVLSDWIRKCSVIDGCLFQALVDSTNIRRKNPSRAAQGYRHRKPTLRRCKETTKRLSTTARPELSEDEQLRIEKRAMYNARQMPFIPLITKMDFSELSEQQNNLLVDILTLLNSSSEEFSFFEQFSIWICLEIAVDVDRVFSE